MTETLERPPLGWFVLDVMRRESRSWDWVAMMISVPPDDLKNCVCDFPARFTVHPDDYRPGDRRADQCFVRIPGKHRNWDAARDAAQKMILN